MEFSIHVTCLSLVDLKRNARKIYKSYYFQQDCYLFHNDNFYIYIFVNF